MGPPEGRSLSVNRTCWCRRSCSRRRARWWSHSRSLRQRGVALRASSKTSLGLPYAAAMMNTSGSGDQTTDVRSPPVIEMPWWPLTSTLARSGNWDHAPRKPLGSVLTWNSPRGRPGPFAQTTKRVSEVCSFAGPNWMKPSGIASSAHPLSPGPTRRAVDAMSRAKNSSRPTVRTSNTPGASASNSLIAVAPSKVGERKASSQLVAHDVVSIGSRASTGTVGAHGIRVVTWINASCSRLIHTPTSNTRSNCGETVRNLTASTDSGRFTDGKYGGASRIG